MVNVPNRSSRLMWAGLWVLWVGGGASLIAFVIAFAFGAKTVGFAFLGLLGVCGVVALTLVLIGYFVGASELKQIVQQGQAEHEQHRQERLAADRLRREQDDQR